ncbi:MAG TPA: hypothetical protein PK151_06965 [Caldisericia bacterium]|nr:hypothetical protein [Caldisericia bacterium]
MKIPSKITFGLADYKVKRVQPNENFIGFHEPILTEINLDKTLKEMLELKTFVHECLHAIIFQYGVDIPESKEEKIVSQMATGVTELVLQMRDK